MRWMPGGTGVAEVAKATETAEAATVLEDDEKKEETVAMPEQQQQEQQKEREKEKEREREKQLQQRGGVMEAGRKAPRVG